MAGNRRPGAAGAPSGQKLPDSRGLASFAEEERTTIDPSPPSSLQQRWDDRTTPEKPPLSKVSGDDETATASGTFEDFAFAQKVQQQEQEGKANDGTLVVIAGNDRGKTFGLTRRRISIGRGIDNDIILTDLAVSRRHLAIEYADDGVAFTAWRAHIDPMFTIAPRPWSRMRDATACVTRNVERLTSWYAS